MHTTRQYDKSQWARGEWDNEPDRVDFIYAGFSCFILRNNSGNWCGYVGVPKEHPAYEKELDFDVHGGITYTSKCQGDICHIPESNMPDDVWWFGFDTAHYQDLVPSMVTRFLHLNEDSTYKNQAYATEETKNLAEQLRDYKG